jgi:hypothetical protein
VHIDRLVLRGFRREDRHGIAEGLRQELERLFSDPRFSVRWSTTTHVTLLSANNVRIDHGARPRQLGIETARGIAKEMKS